MFYSKDQLITKEGEDYIFTSNGEMECYYRTLEKIITQHMQTTLAYKEDTINQRIIDFQTFSMNTFHNIDDFTNKMNEIATFIGEKEPTRLINLVGKEYLNILEIIKKNLLNTEIPIYQRLYEDPLRTHSIELLEKYSQDFLKSKPLDIKHILLFDQPKEEDTPKEEDKKEKSTEQNSHEEPIVLNITGGVSKNKETNVETQTENIARQLPGEIFLETFGDLFKNIQPIDMYSIEEYDKKMIEISEEKENQQKETNNKQNSNTNTDSTPSSKSIIKQITIKEYAQATIIVSKFNKTKDTKGYSEWFSKLSNKYKAMIYMNKLMIQEIQGTHPVWADEFPKISTQLMLPIILIKQILENIKLYHKILMKLQSILKTFGDEAMLHYFKIIEIMNNNERLESKVTTLKFLLLSIQDQSKKETVIKDITQLFEELR